LLRQTPSCCTNTQPFKHTHQLAPIVRLLLFRCVYILKFPVDLNLTTPFFPIWLPGKMRFSFFFSNIFSTFSLWNFCKNGRHRITLWRNYTRG
jgi:hypothetical protein